MSVIDVNFDFTSDTGEYWDHYWNRDPILGCVNRDPDSASNTMQLYHKLLYSKPLPNGEIMDLKAGSGANYLTWKHFRFGSDSIIVSFRYKCFKNMIEQVADSLANYHEYMENYIHKSCTIGGKIIFPKRKGGINQSRGCNQFIKDRWDLTLECIRRYYINEESPMSDILAQDKDFFDLFVDFKGYVDYFYLQDCVSSDYSKVVFWLGNGEFKPFPLPETVGEYLKWIEQELEFVKMRNNRIDHAVKGLIF